MSHSWNLSWNQLFWLLWHLPESFLSLNKQVLLLKTWTGWDYVSNLDFSLKEMIWQSDLLGLEKSGWRSIKGSCHLVSHQRSECPRPREWREVLSHFFMGLVYHVSISTVMSYFTIMVGLIIRLQSKDVQNICINWEIFGSKEIARDPGTLVLIWV